MTTGSDAMDFAPFWRVVCDFRSVAREHPTGFRRLTPFVDGAYPPATGATAPQAVSGVTR